MIRIDNMNIIRRIIEVFAPDEQRTGARGTGQQGGADLTNQRMLDELVADFNCQLEAYSFGERMLYPMSFTIVLHREDFNARRESFVFLVPEVLKAFYAILRERKPAYADATNPAVWWNFHFVPSELPSILCGERELSVEKGHLCILASLFDESGRKDTEVSEQVNISVRRDQSNRVDRVNINREALLRLTLLGDCHFREAFDASLLEDGGERPSQRPQPQPSGQQRALVRYSRQRKTYTYRMEGDRMRISGRSDHRPDRDIFRLESDQVQVNHAEIRFFPEERRFKLAAFAPVTVDEVEVPLSKGGDLRWTELSRRSQLFMGDIDLTFESTWEG